MLAVNEIITKINTLLSGGSLTQAQVAQLSAAVKSIEDYGVSAVATATDLPNPVTNAGRFFYIVDEAKYTFSNGLVWSIEGTLLGVLSPLFMWGVGTGGAMGDTFAITRSSPVSVVGFTDWIQVSTGGGHGAGLRADGTLWAWGCNSQGILGDNTTIAKSSPVSVVGGITNWIEVSLGGGSSFAIRADGTLWAWGSNGNYQLGVSLFDNFSRTSPVQVQGGFTDWIQVSPGSSASTIALRANGTAYAWGFGASGVLGTNSTDQKSSPTLVAGGFTDWIQVALGQSHGLGLRANGTLWSWGANGNGELGDNTAISKSSPVAVVGGFTDWIQVSAGGDHSLGIRANGTLWAWGGNANGELGVNSTTDRSSPVSVVGGFTDWTQVNCGVTHTVGLRANGTAWAWGGNNVAQLGDNTLVNKSSPVSVVGGYTDWIQISTRSNISGALRG